MELTENQKLYAEIVNKAWEDADFKARLVANPVATIEEFTGKKMNLPEGTKMVVRDQTDENKVYINIPRKTQTEELSEEQLEKVAGGIIGDDGCTKPGDLTVGPYNPFPIDEIWLVNR